MNDQQYEYLKYTDGDSPSSVTSPLFSYNSFWGVSLPSLIVVEFDHFKK